MEMLPWDSWSGMVGPDGEITDELLALYDRLAKLTLDSDANFAELRRLCESDSRLKVPDTVFNAVANRMDTVA